MSGNYLPTSSSSSGNANAIPQKPTSSSNLSKALHDTTTPNLEPPTLTCPVLGCSLVFKGNMPYGYLWRHLKRPGVHQRTEEEKAAWENLYKIEHEPLLATRRIALLSTNSPPGY